MTYYLFPACCPAEALVKLALFYSTSVDFLIGLADHPDPYPRSDGREQHV